MNQKLLTIPCITPSFVLCVMFCRSLFVLLYFFFWPLCCLFFFDLRILVTPFGIFKLFLVCDTATTQSYQNVTELVVGGCFSFCTFSFDHYVVCPSLNIAKNRVTQTPLKTEGELRCSGRVSSSAPLVATVVLI
jgi:hypothetical protein